MSLALREMRRAKARFGLLIAAIALLVFLILTQQAIQDGLVTSFVGAIRQQTAPVLVYSTDGQRTFQGSAIPPPLEEQIRGADGVGSIGRIGQGTFTVSVAGRDSTEDAVLIGAEDPALGGVDDLAEGRAPEGDGEAVGSAADFEVGDRVRIVPVGVPGGDGPELEVVGLADDAQLQVTPTLFTSWATYEASARSANPDAEVILPNVLGVAPARGGGGYGGPRAPAAGAAGPCVCSIAGPCRRQRPRRGASRRPAQGHAIRAAPGRPGIAGAICRPAVGQLRRRQGGQRAGRHRRRAAADPRAARAPAAGRDRRRPAGAGGNAQGPA